MTSTKRRWIWSVTYSYYANAPHDFRVNSQGDLLDAVQRWVDAHARKHHVVVEEAFTDESHFFIYDRKGDQMGKPRRIMNLQCDGMEDDLDAPVR